MALLSNEQTLFKELNLVEAGGNETDPKDFYNFLIHRVLNVCGCNVNNNKVED